MNRKHLQKQHASWIEGLQTSITRVIVTTWYYQMNTYPWWTNHRLMKFQGGKDLTILRWYKWYNVAMIKLDWGWIFLDPFPVDESAIWAVETQEISSAKERKGKETGRYRKIEKKENLVSFRKTGTGSWRFSSPNTVSLYILQCVELICGSEIWKRSSTQRPMQCSSALKRTLIPFSWSKEL